MQFGCGLLDGSYLGLAYARSWSDDPPSQTMVLAGKTALGTAREGEPTSALSRARARP